jgi:outer membrane protein OmpA-like peptidoglycan-associated protein
MNIRKISAILIVLTLGVLFANEVYARSIEPAIDERGKFITDSKGNCVRTKWIADQCCDPCGFLEPQVNATPVEPPKDPKPKVLMRETMVTYVDLIRQSVYFKIDKDNIDAEDRGRMNEVIREIQNSDGVKTARLVGYADRFASDEYNIDLSRRRAQNVLGYFNSQGYFTNDDKIRFGYFGERRPVTECPTNLPIPEQVACLQADRRVDIEVELYRKKLDVIKEVVYEDEYGNISREMISELDSFEYVPPAGIEFEEIEGGRIVPSIGE